MMLFRLSLKNLKQSFRDYAIYFITLVLGVCIFYVFNSLDSQTAMLKMSEATYAIVDLIKTVISGVSVFVSAVLGFLIIYASRFLIKKRGREFGVYMMLGMSKRKIALMLLLETLGVGIISLLAGLIVGVFVSQITSILIANLFEADMTSFTFNFSFGAMAKTLIYFGIIYLIVMIFNTTIINKCKLIDLLNAEKKNEKVHFENPVWRIVAFICAVALLGSAYYMVTDGFYDIFATKPMEFLLVPIMMGVVGTVLFFWSASGLFLKIVSRFKNVYTRKLNTFALKELSSQFNTAVVAMSMISIMLFLTICLLSSALSIKDYYNESLAKYAPVDVEMQIFNNNAQSQELESEFLKNNFKNIASAKVFNYPGFDYKYTLGETYLALKEKFPFVSYDVPVDIVAVSDYNNMAEILNLEKVEVNDDEYAIVNNYETEIYNEVLKLGTDFEVYGKSLKPKSEKVVDGFLLMEGGAANIGFFVVPDMVVENQKPSSYLMAGNYDFEDEQLVLETNRKIRQQATNSKETVILKTKAEVKDNSIGLSAMVTFIGIYLGLIFLISSAAILALKQFSDSIDNRQKYEILRKIGASEEMIDGAIFKQTLIFFLAPLLLAILHTIFGVKFCLLVLESMGIDSLTGAILKTAMLIILIYGIYFIITYWGCKRIAKDRISSF